MSKNRDEVLERMIKEEQPGLKRFFHTMAPQSEVYDLTQQTLLAFVEARDRITGNERAYLRGIARYQVLKYYEKRRNSVPFESAVHTATDVDKSFSSLLDERTRLLRALHALPFDQHVAFLLRHGEEMQLEDVAQVIGVSLATVKRYLDAATASLRTSLGAEADRAGEQYRDL